MIFPFLVGVSLGFNSLVLRVLSRLDRIPISEALWDRWDPASQWVLPCDVSDHSPLVLRYSSTLGSETM